MQNARRAHKIRLCGHLRRYKKIVKKTYIIYWKLYYEKAKKAARVNVPKVKNVSLKACLRRFGRQCFMHIAQNISV